MTANGTARRIGSTTTTTFSVKAGTTKRWERKAVQKSCDFGPRFEGVKA